MERIVHMWTLKGESFRYDFVLIENYVYVLANYRDAAPMPYGWRVDTIEEARDLSLEMTERQERLGMHLDGPVLEGTVEMTDAEMEILSRRSMEAEGRENAVQTIDSILLWMRARGTVLV